MKATAATTDKKALLRCGLSAAVAAALCYAFLTSPYVPRLRSTEDVRLFVAGYGAVAPLAYVLLYTLRPLLFFPTLLLNLSAGVLFGPAAGTGLVLAGGLGCATTCYLLGRFGGGSWLLTAFGGRWGERVRHFLAGEDCFAKMLWLRTVPIFPYDPVSILAGSLELPFGLYAGATLLGMVPGAVAYNLLADGVGKGRFYIALIVAALAFGLPLFLWRRKKGRFWPRKEEKAREDEENGAR